MLPLTTIGLLKVMPRAVDVAAAFVGPLNQAMARRDISTPARIAAFLAQVAHESAELTRLEEYLNYRAETLQKVWPSRFPTLLDAERYARNPERIANFVYGGQLGNGPADSGDGWRYRGRGLLQVTGRANYRACSIAIAGDADTLLLNPELLATPEYAAESAGWFWNLRGLNAYADRGDFEGITRRINGGLNGLVDRVGYWHRATSMLIA